MSCGCHHSTHTPSAQARFTSDSPRVTLPFLLRRAWEDRFVAVRHRSETETSRDVSSWIDQIVIPNPVLDPFVSKMYCRLTEEVDGGSGHASNLELLDGSRRFARFSGVPGISSFSDLATGGSTNWNCIAYGAGLYVRVGSGGAIQTSPTGAAGTWTTRESGTTGSLNSVVYKGDGANQGFWAVGGSARLYSADGVTWETKSTTGGNFITFSTTSPDRGFIGGFGYFVYITTDGGSTWTTVDQGDSQGCRAAAFIGSDLYYVTRNTSSGTATRVRRIAWESPSYIVTVSPDIYPFFDRQMLVLESGRVVISGDSGGIYYSDTPNTPESWVSVTVSGAGSLRLMEVNGVLFAFGENGASFVSVDNGATWNKSVERFVRGLWLFEAADISGTSVMDRSGYGHTGTLIGSPSFGTAPIGRSVVFDNTAKRVNMGNVLNIGTGSLSISVWVKTTDSSGSGNDNQVVNKRGTGTAQLAGYQLGIVNDGVLLRIADGAVGRDLFSGNIGITDGQWHHVVAVWERSGTGQVRPIIYVDGATVPNSSGFVSLGSVTNDVSLQIGAGAGGDFHRFDGEIAAPTIYPGLALSLAEAQAIYAAESQGERYMPNHPPDTGVSTFLRFGMADPANPTRAIIVGDSGVTLAGEYGFRVSAYTTPANRSSDTGGIASAPVPYASQPVTINVPNVLSVKASGVAPGGLPIDFQAAKKLLAYASPEELEEGAQHYAVASWTPEGEDPAPATCPLVAVGAEGSPTIGSVRLRSNEPTNEVFAVSLTARASQYASVSDQEGDTNPVGEETFLYAEQPALIITGSGRFTLEGVEVSDLPLLAEITVIPRQGRADYLRGFRRMRKFEKSTCCRFK